jgi:hypothetical protein
MAPFPFGPDDTVGCDIVGTSNNPLDLAFTFARDRRLAPVADSL